MPPAVAAYHRVQVKVANIIPNAGSPDVIGIE